MSGIHCDPPGFRRVSSAPASIGRNYNIVSTDENNDGKKDLSLSYELLNVLANLGLKFAQQFTFIPDSVGVVMTSSTGQVRSGALGDAFAFTAPDTGGDLVTTRSSRSTGVCAIRPGSW